MLFLDDKENCQDFYLTIGNMVHYSSTELGAYVKDKYGYRLTVLDLKGAGLFMVPKAVTELSEIQILVLDENKLLN